MAVVSVNELFQRRRSSTRDGKTTHTRSFQVRTDDVADGTAVALTADGVPGPGSFYRGVPFAGKDADPIKEHDTLFEVTVEFSGDGDDPEEDDVHPLDRPPEVSFGADNLTESYFLDCSDPPKPVANSATEAPDQLLERERGELVITFVRNVEWWSAVEMETYGNTINEELIYIDGDAYPSETLRLMPPTAVRQAETIQLNGEPVEVVYYRATFVLKARASGWNDRLLDVGYSELVERHETVNGQPQLVKRLQPIYDRAAGTLRKPALLDGAGRRLTDPDAPPVELEFKPYTKRSWQSLYF